MCKVNSYGKTWTESRIKNIHHLQVLCDKYYGDNGRVDVYSNNPDLSDLTNSGDVKFIPSVNDFNLWESYNVNVELFNMYEDTINKWENRDNLPLNRRPRHEPLFSREENLKLKEKIDSMVNLFVFPVNYNDK